MSDIEEKLASALMALDRAHLLLSVIDRYDGEAITEKFVDECKKWVNEEYNPETRTTKPCDHRWKRAPLDGTMHCIRCGVYGGNSH